MVMEIRGIDWNLEGYKKEAHFFLCGAFESFDFIHSFLKKGKEFPWIMKDNVVIDSVFGSPTCIWNGGRTLADVYYNKQQLKNIHDSYADLDVKVRFTFTNPFLDEHDMYDRYCNLIMDVFQDLAPEVVVNSSLLEEYLRSKYPTISFISSTTKRLRRSDSQLKEFSHDYKYICLDYDYNYNFEFLDSIQEEERNRVEILINSICPKGCNVRVLHQEFSAKRQLEYDNDDNCDESEPFFKGCPLIKRSKELPCSMHGYTKDFLRGTNYILPQDLDKYLDKGYSHFKIQGRELTISQMFAEFFPYLIRPEFYPMAISVINNGK
jgi:collagenase-like PrtC family protease